MLNVISLLGRIDALENQKMNLVLQGAEVRPELQKQFESVDKKLDKLYAWYARSYLNGVQHVTEPQLRPGILVTGKAQTGKRPA